MFCFPWPWRAIILAFIITLVVLGVTPLATIGAAIVAALSGSLPELAG